MLKLKAPGDNNPSHAISAEAAGMSKLLSGLIEQAAEDEEETVVEIRDDLREVSDQSVIAAIKYFEIFKNETPTQFPTPLGGPAETYMTEKEKEFVAKELLDGDKPNQDKLIDVMYVAHFLIAPALVGLTTAWISSRVLEITRKTKDPLEAAEQIRQLLNIPNSWTTEQMEALKAECEWPEA